MRQELERTGLLLSQEAMGRIMNSKIAVFGVGGVGSYVVEALARAGVGELRLIDNDTVSITNINRQLIALHSTVGRPKVLVEKERVLDINPFATVKAYQEFYLPSSELDFITGCDYVVDAIDTVSAKLSLVEESRAKSIPVISSMGTGNKLNPALLQIGDIYETSVCPLCRVMRRELKKRGVPSLKVLYSKEEPVKPALNPEMIPEHKRQVPGSVSFVPSVAGLLIASEVIHDLIR